MRAPDNAHLYQRLNRFTWLMDLYTDNFQRLQAMAAIDRLPPGAYLSEGLDGLLLRLEVLERHAFTVELRLSYTLCDPLTGAPDPSAMIRVYLDSRQCEVSHCYVGRRWQDALGVNPSTQRVVSHRLRMNGFLNKWLQYLAQQGHGRGRWHPEHVPERLSEA